MRIVVMMMMMRYGLSQVGLGCSRRQCMHRVSHPSIHPSVYPKFKYFEARLESIGKSRSKHTAYLSYLARIRSEVKQVLRRGGTMRSRGRLICMNATSSRHMQQQQRAFAADDGGALNDDKVDDDFQFSIFRLQTYGAAVVPVCARIYKNVKCKEAKQNKNTQPKKPKKKRLMHT